jgi:large subunit ribosomal protein L3
MEQSNQMLELVGKKIGMSHIFKDGGILLPLTMIQIYENCIIEIKINKDKNFDNLIMAFEPTSPKKLQKPIIGVFNKKQLPLFKKIRGSRIKKGLDLKVGQSIIASSVIKEGDKINVSGYTIGKGFAGVMKRWNFRGLEASHGVSVSHRSHGSTGQRQDPGKTFRGKKMSGHMGAENITVKNLEVIIIDKHKSIIAIKGSIPGNDGSDVVLKIMQNS